MNSKEKIGLITFYRDNYGSILQCYATKSFIEHLGFQCDLLSLKKKKTTFFQRIIKFLKYSLKILRYPSFAKVLYKERTYKRNLSDGSAELMDEFTSKILKPCETDYKTLCNTTDYAYYITGSDQVWNVGFLFYPIRFLKFAPRHKRIALAASFGVSEIPSFNQVELRSALNGFDYISVREESAVDIVKTYSNAKVSRIADPTFIYDADEWKKFAQSNIKVSSKYILIHFLCEPNDVAISSIKWFSESFDFKILALGYKYDVFAMIENLEYINGDPCDYLSLIEQAEIVLTDSFHSSLFSINFDKRFFVFQRQYAVLNQSSRIIDLLKRFGIENRFISDVNFLKKHYMDNLPRTTRDILIKERSVIRDFIQKSIIGQVPQCFVEKNKVGKDD